MIQEQTLTFFRDSTIPDSAYIYIDESTRIVKLFVKDICYAEYLGDRLHVYAEKESYKAKCSIDDFERSLEAWPFIRIGKNYLVSIPRIVAFNSISVEVANTNLSIGRGYKDEVFSALRYFPEGDISILNIS